MFSKVGNYLIYLIYKFFKVLFLSLPYKITQKIIDNFAYLVYKLNKKHKKIAQANLDLVFGKTISQERKDEIIYTSYKSLAYNMFEFVENQNLSKDKFFKKFNEIGAEYIQRAIDEKRNIIFIAAHYGAWEAGLPYVALRFGINLAVVNRKMNNPFIHKEYKKGRAKNSIYMIDKRVAAKEMIKSIKSGVAVTVVIDQHIGNGTVIEFLGQKCMATDSTSRLALKFDAVLIPVFAICNGFRDYTIKILEPIDVKKVEFKSENKIEELTQMQNDILTKQIFEYPDLWFWQHKRFKKFHRHIYIN